MNYLLTLKNISLSFGEHRLFQNLNANLPQQRIVGLLGPNGCGKTSLLKIMAGLLKPQEGEIYFEDKNLKQYSRRSLAQNIAVLPQENSIDFPFKALEIVLMGRYPYLKTFQWENAQDLQIAREAMELTDSWKLAPQDIRELSGGERERVLLARALAQNSKLLLLDEPITHLDLQHQQRTYQLLKNLNQKKKITMVVVLHDLNFAMGVCDEVWLFDTQGKIHRGDPKDILTSEKIKASFGVSVKVQKSDTENIYLQMDWN